MSNLDKFYTKEPIAKDCVSELEELFSLDTFSTIIEPSAGNGSFIKALPQRTIALDIEPEAEGIIQQDWLEYKEKSEEPLLIIGNPPFGKRSTLAKDFIKHSVKLGADVIAFILPSTFKKLSNQSLTIFPKNYKLIDIYDLPKSSFLEEGEDYGLTCSFFIWAKGDFAEGKEDLRKVKIADVSDFEFLQRGSTDADFCINGNSGAVRDVGDITNSKSEHYIAAKGLDAASLRVIFENLEYEWLSSVPGGNSWIGRQEILEAYKK